MSKKINGGKTFMDSFAVIAIIVGLILIVLGYFWMRSQDVKSNSFDTIFSIIFLDPFLSGIGIMIVGILAILLGIYTNFH